jgi:hypothetical protein
VTTQTKYTPDPDLIRGQRRIAEFYGVSKRLIPDWHRTREIPTFMLGGSMFLRRSAALEHMGKLEETGGKLPPAEPPMSQPQPDSPPRRRRGWPAGRKRGPRKPKVPTPTPSAA